MLKVKLGCLTFQRLGPAINTMSHTTNITPQQLINQLIHDCLQRDVQALKNKHLPSNTFFLYIVK